MIHNKKEFDAFVRMVFSGCDIQINGVPAAADDLAQLCRDVSAGKTNVTVPIRMMSGGKMTRICVETR